MKPASDEIFDVFIIGGGVNGCGIARDAAGRGYKVALAEKGDLAQGTSSASSKLIHGGLRYLEYFEFRLVREALEEREKLLNIMPHIAWPMRFILPYSSSARFEASTPASRLLGFFFPWLKGRRPEWMIRLGLMLYDRLGKRDLLPGTAKLNLRNTPEGAPLNERFKRAYEYSDIWVDDARLVILNALDAKERGATIMRSMTVTSAEVIDDNWQIKAQSSNGVEHVFRAKTLVNAGGPWASKLLEEEIKVPNPQALRLVRGSHIIVPRLYDHEKCYFLQGEDGRIIFIIPYEKDFTLIGTTDADHGAPDEAPSCSEEERDYLLDFANQYLINSLSKEDIIWSYSGVRPLEDSGEGSASAASRDYRVEKQEISGCPLINIFGGKLTTYRKLGESALDLVDLSGSTKTQSWTLTSPLPGGDFLFSDKENQLKALHEDYPFLDHPWAERLVRTYGTRARNWLGNAKSVSDLGTAFGATLTAREVSYLMREEFAEHADDVLWRRTKLGLRLNAAQSTALGEWMSGQRKANL